MHLNRQLNCRSLRCSWSIACRRCSNYIFILDLTPGFKGLAKDDFNIFWIWCAYNRYFTVHFISKQLMLVEKCFCGQDCWLCRPVLCVHMVETNSQHICMGKMNYLNGKVVRMTALVVIGHVEGKLQRPQWRPGQSPWPSFCVCELPL